MAGGIARLFALIAAPILTHWLGPAPYGVVSLVGTFTALGSTVGLHGIDMSYARYYFTKSESKRVSVERFCWRYALLSSLMVSLITTLCWTVFVKIDTSGHLVSLMVGIGTFLYILSTMSQTRSRLDEKYRKIALSIVISGAFSTLVTIGLAYWWRRDEWPLLIGLAIGILISILILGIPELKSLYDKSGLSLSERWNILRLGLTGMITGPMYWILSSADRWFINSFVGKEALGVYSFAGGIAYIGQLVNSAILYTWFPESIKAYEENSQNASEVLGRIWEGLTLLLALVWFVVASLGGDLIRLLTAPQFHSGAIYIPWIAGGVFFNGMSHLANTELLIGKNMKPAAFWWTVGAIFSLLLNYLLVRDWGAFGASITYCISFAMIFIGVMWRSSKRFKLKIDWKKLSGATIILLCSGILTHKAWHSNPFASMCYKIPICASISLIIVKLFVPGWITRMKLIFTGEEK
jgi:O-antigen/teichoic acid export membrane protein